MDKYDIKPIDKLIRRIPKVVSHIRDGIPTSAVFKLKKDEDGVSVDIKNLTSIEDSIKDFKKYSAGIILAEIPMNNGCECTHDPIEDNNAHALIKDVTNRIAKILAKNCKVIENES